MTFNEICIISSDADELFAYMIYDFLNNRKAGNFRWKCLEPRRAGTDPITGCIASILIVSSHSNTSPRILQEVKQVADSGIPVIPVQIEEVEPSEALQYYIGSVQWLNASAPPFEDHLETLYSVLERTIKIPYASFEERSAAYVIDIALIAVPTLVVIGFCYLVPAFGIFMTNLPFVTISVLNVFIFFFVPYTIILEMPGHGGTIGKRIMNLQVTEKNGEQLSLHKTVLRSVLKIFLVFPLGLSIPVTARKTALYDSAAGTVVINRTVLPESDALLAKVSAGSHRRVIAFVIDLVIILFIVFFLLLGFNILGRAIFAELWIRFFYSPYYATWDPSGIFPFSYDLDGIVFLFISTGLMVYILYFTLMERSRWGSSFGKYLMDLMILSSSHKKMSVKESFLRSVLKVTPIVLFSGSLLFSRKTRTILDRIAGTIVIKRKL